MDAPENASTVRLSVFVDPGDSNRALACVSESPAGASSWHSVDLTKLYKPIGWEYSKLLYALSKEDSQNHEAVGIGRSLYDNFFVGDTAQKLASVHPEITRPLRRLAIDCPKELVGIPWELLHDGNDFLLSLEWSIIRVARELASGVAYFGPISSVALVAVAPDFDPSEHLARLDVMFKSLNVQTTSCRDPDRAELRAFLDGLTADALYFLGHGSKGKIQLRANGTDTGWLEARDLAQWLPDPQQTERRINLAYFSSCATARSDEGSVFSGVAQRLMLSGRVGTVVAMQANIELPDALCLGEAFFERLVRMGDPERALSVARTALPSVGGRSIPVLYTHVRGPEAFRKNRVSRFLGASPDDDVCISLPEYVMGMKYDDYKGIKQPLLALLGDLYHYRGNTYARSDIEAAKEFLDLLSSFGSLNKIELVGDEQLPDCSTTFVFGSKSHLRSLVLNEEYGAEFTTRFEERSWTIVDSKCGREYSIESPVVAMDYEASDDFGFVEKTVRDGRCYFFVTGLGDRATRGCAYYIAEHWEELLATHLDQPFAELFRFPGGLPFTHGERLDRLNNPLGKPAH